MTPSTRLVIAVAAFTTVAVCMGDGNGLRFGRLIAYDQYEETGDMCVMPAAWQREAVRAAYQESTAGSRRALPANLPASGFKEYLRRIRDEYPTFASVSVDTVRDEVVLTDESTFKI